MRIKQLIPLLVLLAVPVEAFASSSLRCDGRLVSIGDYKFDVQETCGPPTFVDFRQQGKTVTAYKRTHSRRPEPHANSTDNPRDLKDYSVVKETNYIDDVEEWTYNFGPDRFVQILVFINGRLASINSGSYGYRAQPSNNPSVQTGDSKAVVAMKYGKPTYTRKNQGDESLFNYREDGKYLYAERFIKPVEEEEWVYDFGPDRFMQKLSFKDNTLVDIRSLKRGTDTPKP